MGSVVPDLGFPDVRSVPLVGVIFTAVVTKLLYFVVEACVVVIALVAAVGAAVVDAVVDATVVFDFLVLLVTVALCVAIDG